MNAPIKLLFGLLARHEQGNGVVFADIHDGDMKKVEIDGEKPAIKITPHGNDQTWVVKTTLDEDCAGLVEFRVPNKPSPPPVPLKVRFGTFNAQLQAVFTDPSGTLPAGPLNVWLQKDVK